MWVKIVIALNFIFWATACAAPAPVNPAVAQQAAIAAWQANRHNVWELEWQAAPVNGPIVVESWQAGNRYRHEILEASAPALLGQTLVFDGQTAWQYNRLFPPDSFEPAPRPGLSPVTEAFALVERLIHTPAQSASQTSAQVNHRPAQQINLTYANGDTLTLWQELETGLPLKVEFVTNGQPGRLTARLAEPLATPPNALFSVGAWAQDIR